MQKITIEESKQFFPAKSSRDASYFTFTPSSRGEGWEDVNYFTNRRKLSYTNRNDDHNSWVYILSNPAQPGILKIGYTNSCLLYTSPSPRDRQKSRMPSSA